MIVRRFKVWGTFLISARKTTLFSSGFVDPLRSTPNWIKSPFEILNGLLEKKKKKEKKGRMLVNINILHF